jgi:hypothetical protein
MVTWPSAAMTTSELRRTQMTVVERMRGRREGDSRAVAARDEFCALKEKRPLAAAVGEEVRFDMSVLSIQRAGNGSMRQAQGAGNGEQGPAA